MVSQSLSPNRVCNLGSSWSSTARGECIQCLSHRSGNCTVVSQELSPNRIRYCSSRRIIKSRDRCCRSQAGYISLEGVSVRPASEVSVDISFARHAVIDGLDEQAEAASERVTCCQFVPNVISNVRRRWRFVKNHDLLASRARESVARNWSSPHAACVLVSRRDNVQPFSHCS